MFANLKVYRDCYGWVPSFAIQLSTLYNLNFSKICYLKIFEYHARTNCVMSHSVLPLRSAKAQNVESCGGKNVRACLGPSR